MRAEWEWKIEVKDVHQTTLRWLRQEAGLVPGATRSGLWALPGCSPISTGFCSLSRAFAACVALTHLQPHGTPVLQQRAVAPTGSWAPCQREGACDHPCRCARAVGFVDTEGSRGLSPILLPVKGIGRGWDAAPQSHMAALRKAGQ